jgi:signal transduction histidine kinase/CheY-like chemotaxis protein
MEAGLISSLRANSRWEGETSLRHLATGAEIPVELTAFSVTDPQSGTQLALAFICRAIGERQRLQQELRQAQKMEAVGRLAGGIAHDFNNLLTVILSYSELLTDVLPVNAPMRAEVEEIRLAGIRAAALTRQLLAFSRQQVLQPKIVNLNEVVAGTDKMLQRLIGEDVELLTVLTPELGDALLDPGQVEQVIMNLAVNSRDAMPDGGKLTIETADVMLEETLERFHEGMSPGPHVMLAVTDTGIGMDKETQSRIFEPFFTTKSPENGTGLGLSTVFGIVKQSGGGIWVYSEVGRGTTIKIYFPRVGREGAPSAPPTTSAPSRGGETVLLVEDDERVRVVAAAGLQRFGYDVLTALTVEDAVHLCEHHRAPIHLLLTDVIMPRMNGPALAEQLRTLRPDMKVLFMSGYTNRSIVNNTILDANTAFIQKPITPERLAHKIRDVLDGTPRS